MQFDKKYKTEDVLRQLSIETFLLRSSRENSCPECVRDRCVTSLASRYGELCTTGFGSQLSPHSVPVGNKRKQQVAE